jgi:hypothetical protein
MWAADAVCGHVAVKHAEHRRDERDGRSVIVSIPARAKGAAPTAKLVDGGIVPEGRGWDPSYHARPPTVVTNLDTAGEVLLGGLRRSSGGWPGHQRARLPGSERPSVPRPGLVLNSPAVSELVRPPSGGLVTRRCSTTSRRSRPRFTSIRIAGEPGCRRRLPVGAVSRWCDLELPWWQPGVASACARYDAGGMFWLPRKKLVGSYAAFTHVSRA